MKGTIMETYITSRINKIESMIINKEFKDSLTFIAAIMELVNNAKQLTPSKKGLYKFALRQMAMEAIYNL